MIQSRSIARELALLVLGQIPEKESSDLQSLAIETLFNKALDSLMEYWREGLDHCALELESAQQKLLDSELQDQNSLSKVRNHLELALVDSEKVLNGLSGLLELPKLLVGSDQQEIRSGAMNRIKLVLENRLNIDTRLDQVMEGWRLKRLPRIDRDILRIAVVDLMNLNTPVAVACNEAVNLAHRYSDEQGRKMINGVLRRLQDSSI